MDRCQGEQVKPGAQVNKLTAYATDFAIIFAKVLAIVPKSGINLGVNHINSTLRCVAASRRRVD